MPPYRRLSDDELDGLDDERLAAHVAESRDRGELAQADRALQIFYSGVEGKLATKIRARFSRRPAESVVEEILFEVYKSVEAALFETGHRAKWEGPDVKSLQAWLNKIAERRTDDYHRKQRPQTVPLITDDDDHKSPEELLEGPDTTGGVSVKIALAKVIQELSPTHQRVVELTYFGNLSSKEAAAEIAASQPEEEKPMTAGNVDKIRQRFRDDFYEQLDGDDRDD